MNLRTTLSLVILSVMLLLVGGCANPQPLPVAPTPIPTLIPATLPPEPTPTQRPAVLGVTFPSRKPSAQGAEALYGEHCANCHGVDGKGTVPGARNFSDADYVRGETPVRFYQIISDGRGSMPSFRDSLTDDERWDLTLYIGHFATPPQILEQGKAIYEQNCVACHGPDGKGVVPGAADFTNFEWVATRAPRDFFQVVTEGRGTMPSWQGRLSPEGRWAAIEYLRTFVYEPLISSAAAKPTEVPPTASPTEELTATPIAPTATPATAAIPTLYTQKGCAACHGDKAQGSIGPILAGLDVLHIKSSVRSGDSEAGMIAFDQDAISDDDLETLAQALSSLTLQDTGVHLSQPVLDHLSQARDALQAGDKAAVETHLKKAQEAAADAPPGVQATLKDMVEDLEEADWAEDLEMHLAVLLAE